MHDCFGIMDGMEFFGNISSCMMKKDIELSWMFSEFGDIIDFPINNNPNSFFLTISLLDFFGGNGSHIYS